MPPGGGYRAGSIYVDLNARLDDSGFARMEKRMRTTRSEADKPITAKLSGDYDSRAFDQYERALRQVRERAQRRQDFKAELGADFHPGAFREYEKALANADRNTRQFGRSQQGLGGSLASFNRNVLALANSFRVLRWPAIIAGAGSAAAALSAATGAATALTAALGPLAGALAAVPAGLSAFAQGMGTLKLASFGVADAFKASEKASVASSSSMKEQRTSAEGVRSAKMSLAAAERTAQGAQESLTRARKDATQQLEDMRRAVSRTALDEESAVLAVKEAREALADAQNDPMSTWTQVDRAELSVRQAQQDLKDVRAEGQRLRQENARAQAGGVENMPEVVDARRSLVDANRAVAESARDIRIAQRDATEALTEGTTAANKYAEEMAKLPPAAQRFVRFLVGLKDEFQRLRTVTAEGLFPGVEDGIRNAMGNLPILEKALGRTAEAFGELAVSAGILVGSPEFGRDLETQTRRNVTLIERGGESALNFAEALQHITIAAGPLVNWMSNYVLRLSETVAWSAKAGRESGGMAKFFEETRLTIDRLLRITADLGQALKNIGVLAYQALGRQLLGDLTKAADKFRQWTESAEGENRILMYFAAITPAIYEFADALAEVTKAFFRIGENQALAPMIAQIRDEALPAIETLVNEVTGTLGPAMVDVITQFARVLANLSQEGGALAAFINGFARVLELIAAITDAVPFIGTVLGTLAAAGGIYKALQVGATITGLRTIGRLIAGGNIKAALGMLVNRVPGGGTAGGVAGGGAMDAFKGRGDTPVKPLFVAVVNPTGGIPPVVGGGRGGGAGTAGRTAGRVGGGVAAGTVARGVVGRIGAGAAGAALGPIGLIGTTLAAMFAPSVIKQITQGSKDVEDALDGIVARARRVSRGDGPSFIAALKDMSAQARRTGSAVDRDLADRIDDVARRFKESGRGMSETAKTVRENLAFNWNLMGRRTDSTFKDISQTVTRNMRLIRGNLGTQSEEGRKAIAQNFRQAREAVRDNMRDKVVSTRRGMRQIRELLAQELKATYGISIAAARYQVTKERVADATGTGSSPGAGLPSNPNQRGGRIQKLAAGGWLGAKGLVGPDTIPIGDNAIAAPGEYFAKGPDGRKAVINRHQAPLVEAMLAGQGRSLDTIPGDSSLPLIERALGGPKGLDGLFNMIQRPHMFARGGIVPVPGFPGERANTSVVGKIVAIAKRFGLTLTDAYGQGHESPGHTKTGTAADFSGPDNGMDAAVQYLVKQGYLVGYDGRFGSQNWPGHGPSTKTSNFHLHVELGGRSGGPITAEMHRKIRAPRLRGNDLASRMVNAGMRMATVSANRLMDKAGEAAVTTPVAGGGGKPANAGQIRQWLAAGLKLAGQKPSAANINTLFGRVMQESSGNPRAQNNWDSNARAGTPSKGLLQTIDPTFNAYKVKGYNNIFNPVHNVAAAVRYMLARYGRLVGRSSTGYQLGGRMLNMLAGGGRSYPLGRRGKIIGTPHAGTHTLGNWQSDNALDIGVPNGTPVLAVADGRVMRLRGSYRGGASQFDGFQVTLGSDIGGVFYTHLMRAGVRAGEQVEAGERIGLSGSANGVPHLHIGFERGKPQRILSAAIGRSGRGKSGTGGAEAPEEKGPPRRGSRFQRELRQMQSVLAWMASRGTAGRQRGGYFAPGGRLSGGKRDAPSVLVSGSALGIRRALKKGVGAYDNAMQSVDNLQKRYTLEERKYGLSEEQLVNDDGSLNQQAINTRVKELDALIALREQILRKLEHARDVARKVVRTLREVIKRYSNSLKHTKNKKDRTNIKAVIANAREQLATFQGAVKDLGPDIENATMDIREVMAERAEVLGTEAAPQQDIEDVSTTTDQTADQAAQLAQAQERERVATERAEISERSLSVLGSAAGMNPSGIGNAPQITINTLHPADPATLSAIAQASNKGNWYGGNVQSSRVVTGV